MKRSVKVVALLLTVIIFISVLTFAFENFNPTPAKAKSKTEASSIDDRRIAGDISNMTGVAVDEILAVRNSGKSWNDVLDELSGGIYRRGSSADKRNHLLSQSGLDENELKMLKKEGFSDDELQRARMLVERMVFQLQEIVYAEDMVFTVPETGSSIENDMEEMHKYRELANCIDIRKCLYLILKLRDEFGSMEEVLNEYLFSLQAGIDLALYIADRGEYLRQRREKEMEPDMQDIITVEKIESKMLELLSQKDNPESNSQNSLIDNVTRKAVDDTDSIIDDILPAIPVPELGDVKPENPADRIKKEIDLLDPMKTGNGGIGQ